MNYRKWISLHITHDYFADNRCPMLRIQPTEACKDRMRRNGHYFYSTGDGFYIFQQIDEKRAAGNGNIDENYVYDIAVYADPLFGSYSNLEIDFRQGMVYYIGNTLEASGNNDDSGKEKKITLTDRLDSTKREAVPVRLVNESFAIPRGSGNAARGNTGFLRVKKKGHPDSYVYIDDNFLYKKPTFIIGIQVPSESLEDDKDSVYTYDLQIPCRLVWWKYHVNAIANGRKLQELVIKNNNEKLLPGISFEQCHIDEEHRKVTFLSNQPIPLSQRPYQSIELIEKAGSETPLIPHLPNAEISSLRVRDKKWTAHMYIYI